MDEIFDFCDIFVGLMVNDCIFLVLFDFYENVIFIYDDDGNVIGVDGMLICNFNEVYLFKLVNVGMFFLIDIVYGKFNVLLGVWFDYFDVELENGWVVYLGDFQGNGVIIGDDMVFSYNISIFYDVDGIIFYIIYVEINLLSIN